MRVFLSILFVAAIAAAAWYVGSTSDSNHSSTSSAQTASLSPGGSAANPTSQHNNDQAVGNTIRCQGKLKPASGLINIVAPPGSRIAKLTNKSVGEKVAQGEMLATLQNREVRAQDLKLAQARRADALSKANYEKANAENQLASARLAVEEANAADERIAAEKQKVRLLEKQLAASESLLNRLSSLRSNPATADLLNQTDLEKQQLMVEQLRLQIDQAELEGKLAAKSANRAKQVAANNVATLEDSIANADEAVPLATLDATIAMAQMAFDMTEIKSPIESATILDIIVREGDSVTNQPVMIIGDTTQMQCVAEVSDQFLHLIDVDQTPPLQATITSPAIDEPLTGTVVAKGVLIGAASLSDPNPFARVDRRTGNVTIQLDDSGKAASLVNLQVEVEIQIGD